jgi:ribonuclease HII
LQLFFQNNCCEAGCDEAGRGSLAGPVFAAAVILPGDFEHPLLNDSKKVTPENREELRIYIEKHATSFGIGFADHKEIDRFNILKASFLAMHRAIAALSVKPELLLIDGNRFSPYPRIPHKCIVKGDALFAPIAAASILAKTYRDQFMVNLHEEHPCYGWDMNKGYGTEEHRKSISLHGLSPYHRRSFHCVDLQMDLPF